MEGLFFCIAACCVALRCTHARRAVLPVQVVCKPGSIKPHKKFSGEIYALSKEEGGRHTPFFTNYKPQFFFRTADITGLEGDGLGPWPTWSDGNLCLREGVRGL